MHLQIKDYKKRIFVATICFILFSIITILVITNNTTRFDDIIYKTIHSCSNNIVDKFFIHFTHIGDTVPVIIIACIIVILLKNWKDRFIVISNLLLTVGVNQALKHIIMRERPPLERRLIKQGGFSYPSGHSMASLCVYGVLMYFVITKVKNKKLKILLTSLLTLMIIMIGVSRIYVGVHYPTDVIGGYLLTIVILIINISLINYHFKGESK